MTDAYCVACGASFSVSGMTPQHEQAEAGRWVRRHAAMHDPEAAVA